MVAVHHSRSWGLNIHKLEKGHRRVLAIAGVDSLVGERKKWSEVRKDLLQWWLLVECTCLQLGVQGQQ